MLTNTAVKYRLWENRKALIIFYLIIYLVMIASIIAVSSVNEVITLNGLEFASMIFIFIVGLEFSEPFQMLLQNGCSRKTIFLSFVYSIIPIATVMALIDGLNGILMNQFTNYENMFLQFYGPRFTEAVGVMQFIEGFLWSLTAYTMVAIIGLFITALYYRMNKQMKWIVSIGVPAFFMIVLPLIDTSFFNGAIIEGIGKVLDFAWGYQNGYNPYFSMISCILFSVIFGSLAYSLIRRAVVRD